MLRWSEVNDVGIGMSCKAAMGLLKIHQKGASSASEPQSPVGNWNQGMKLQIRGDCYIHIVCFHILFDIFFLIPMKPFYYRLAISDLLCIMNRKRWQELILCLLNIILDSSNEILSNQINFKIVFTTLVSPTWNKI